jgi:hypothetical protein
MSTVSFMNEDTKDEGRTPPYSSFFLFETLLELREGFLLHADGVLHLLHF